MTFTFDASLGTSRDKVRLYIGDTVSAGHLVENETITALLVDQPNPVRVAITLARSLAAVYARKADKAIGKTKVDQAKVAENFLMIAEALEAMGDVDGAGMTAAVMAVGGISEDKREDLVYGDSDRIQPNFQITKDDILPATSPRNEEP